MLTVCEIVIQFYRFISDIFVIHLSLILSLQGPTGLGGARGLKVS